MIVKQDGKYAVKSEDGKKNLGSGYGTQQAAERRLRQIEWFKAHPDKGKK